jgi:hypothetical protein
MAQGIKAARALLIDYVAALNTAEGLPRRSRVVGGPDLLPRNYSVGAAGWTDAVCEIYDTDDNRLAIDIPNESRKYLGKTIRVGARNITLPNATTQVARKRVPP